MGEQENRHTIELWAKTLESGDMEQMLSAFSNYVTDDFVQEWPQSGERIRGKENAMAINKNYPGMPKMELGEIRVSGDLAVMQVTLDYGQGPVHGISVFEMRDGKVAKEIDYFADPFEAPEWRAQWVEKM